MLQEEDETKIDLTEPMLTNESFVDLSRVVLKDGAKMVAELKQEEKNMAFREELHLCN